MQLYGTVIVLTQRILTNRLVAGNSSESLAHSGNDITGSLGNKLHRQTRSLRTKIVRRSIDRLTNIDSRAEKTYWFMIPICTEVDKHSIRSEQIALACP